MTIRRALEGKPVRAATATTLAQLTGWKVEAGALALGADPSSATKPKRPASNPPRRGARRGIGRGA